ncbi:flagellar biosynthetic protein FliR [Spartinivicinus ruber]|uniref:flagellar biosynthetic protein FliR n=1 Tax=Spartinivicinus ruber TaxID=2683272 RepID=UPI0038B69045
MFILDFCLGVVGKTMPQLNVYFFALPLKLVLGSILLAMLLYSSAELLADLIANVVDYLSLVLSNHGK